MASRQHSFIILFIVAATFLVYYDSFNNAFVYDDRAYVEENTAMRSLERAHILSFFTDRIPSLPTRVFRGMCGGR